MNAKRSFFRTEAELLDVEDFIKAMAIGSFFLMISSPLAIFFPVVGFNLFLLFFVVPYYSGYQAGKRTDHGQVAGFTLGVAWTAVEFILLFLIGNTLALSGRVRITSITEMGILLLVFLANTASCWLGGRVGTQKRFFHRRVEPTQQG